MPTQPLWSVNCHRTTEFGLEGPSNLIPTLATGKDPVLSLFPRCKHSIFSEITTSRGKRHLPAIGFGVRTRRFGALLCIFYFFYLIHVFCVGH